MLWPDEPFIYYGWYFLAKYEVQTPTEMGERALCIFDRICSYFPLVAVSPLIYAGLRSFPFILLKKSRVGRAEVAHQISEVRYPIVKSFEDPKHLCTY